VKRGAPLARRCRYPVSRCTKKAFTNAGAREGSGISPGLIPLLNLLGHALRVPAWRIAGDCGPLRADAGTKRVRSPFATRSCDRLFQFDAKYHGRLTPRTKLAQEDSLFSDTVKQTGDRN